MITANRVALLAALLLAACTERAAPPARSGSRPNIVVVVVDDLRWDEFGAAGHPFVETPNIDRLAREGAMFTRAFHAVPLCSPNRASLLTGQYPSTHGIIDNVARSYASHHLNTFPRALQQVGYRTAFLGKWHMGNDPTPRPGFDYWVSFPGQGRSINPQLFENGRLGEVTGYTTDLLTDRAVEFIDRQRDGPFLLYLAHKAIHPDIRQRDDGSIDPNSEGRYIPAPRHQGRYETRTYPRTAQIAVLAELDGKPAVQRALARLPSGTAPQADDETIRRRAEMLLAIDEGLGRLLAKLEAKGILDSTVIMFTSDNGFFFGEHGLTTERRLPYEPSIRNALLVRYPPLVAAGTRPAELTVTVDIAPTLLELAGAPVGAHIQGRSLVPVLRGQASAWRESLLVEFYTYENPFPHLVDMDYRAIRTARYKYIHWMQYPQESELYDLDTDPQELHNLAGDPRLTSVQRGLQDDLGRLVLASLRLRGEN